MKKNDIEKIDFRVQNILNVLNSEKKRRILYRMPMDFEILLLTYVM